MLQNIFYFLPIFPIIIKISYNILFIKGNFSKSIKKKISIYLCVFVGKPLSFV